MWIQCPDCGGMFKVSFYWEFFFCVGVLALTILVMFLLALIIRFFFGNPPKG